LHSGSLGPGIRSGFRHRHVEKLEADILIALPAPARHANCPVWQAQKNGFGRLPWRNEMNAGPTLGNVQHHAILARPAKQELPHPDHAASGSLATVHLCFLSMRDRYAEKEILSRY
jgi:hypothetical protein